MNRKERTYWFYGWWEATLVTQEASMKDVVSSFGIPVVSLVASLSIVWIVYVPYRFPWAVLLFVGGMAALAASAALLVFKSSTRSLTEVIAAVEAEPERARVARMRVASPAPKAIL
jgi:hypothetical protein